MVRLGILLLALITVAIIPTALSARPIPAPSYAWVFPDRDAGWYRDRDGYHRHRHYRHRDRDAWRWHHRHDRRWRHRDDDDHYWR